RAENLANRLLSRLERKYSQSREESLIPERVRNVRRDVIRRMEQEGLPVSDRESLAQDLDDLFFVIQLYSYPGDYVAERPVIERIAETLDRSKKDLLQPKSPGAGGARRAIVQFGTPLEIPADRKAQGSVAEWTALLERQVQAGLDTINASEKV